MIIEKPLISNIINLYLRIISKLDKIPLTLLIFFIRVWMARIFWYSGLTKIADWESTVALFKYEYKVPIISPEIASILSTAVELCCPVLLILGLATRLATIPMIFMVIIIEITYLDMREHYYWIMLLLMILTYGPGKISLDNLLKTTTKIIIRK
jgi:putative oxidoreductase